MNLEIELDGSEIEQIIEKSIRDKFYFTHDKFKCTVTQQYGRAKIFIQAIEQKESE